MRLKSSQGQFQVYGRRYIFNSNNCRAVFIFRVLLSSDIRLFVVLTSIHRTQRETCADQCAGCACAWGVFACDCVFDVVAAVFVFIAVVVVIVIVAVDVVRLPPSEWAYRFCVFMVLNAYLLCWKRARPLLLLLFSQIIWETNNTESKEREKKQLKEKI